MFFLCSLLGDGHVEGICGRSGGVGVDQPVRRDDRGLGAVDPPALTSAGSAQGAGTHPGEKPDGGRQGRVAHGLPRL